LPCLCTIIPDIVELESQPTGNVVVVTMPNKRSRNKVHIGGYVDRKFKRKLTLLAKRLGMRTNRFRCLVLLAERGMQRGGNVGHARTGRWYRTVDRKRELSRSFKGNLKFK